MGSAGLRLPSKYFTAAGIGVPVSDHPRDLPRAGGLCPGRPHRQADAPAESESTAAHRLDGSSDDGDAGLRLGQAGAGGSPLLQKAQAGHGADGAGGAGFQLSSGIGTVGGRPDHGGSRRLFGAESGDTGLSSVYGGALHRSGPFQSGANPAAGRCQGAVLPAAGSDVRHDAAV